MEKFDINKLSESQYEQIECPICLNARINPKQCKNCKNKFCFKCVKTLNSCPLCRISPMVIEDVEYDCPNPDVIEKKVEKLLINDNNDNNNNNNENNNNNNNENNNNNNENNNNNNENNNNENNNNINENNNNNNINNNNENIYLFSQINKNISSFIKKCLIKYLEDRPFNEKITKWEQYIIEDTLNYLSKNYNDYKFSLKFFTVKNPDILYWINRRVLCFETDGLINVSYKNDCLTSYVDLFGVKDAKDLKINDVNFTTIQKKIEENVKIILSNKLNDKKFEGEKVSLMVNNIIEEIYFFLENNFPLLRFYIFCSLFENEKLSEKKFFYSGIKLNNNENDGFLDVEYKSNFLYSIVTIVLNN